MKVIHTIHFQLELAVICFFIPEVFNLWVATQTWVVLALVAGLSVTQKNKIEYKKNTHHFKPQRNHSSIKVLSKCHKIQYFVETLLKIRKPRCHKRKINISKKERCGPALCYVQNKPKLQQSLQSSTCSPLALVS